MSSFVYFIQAGANGPVKIGFADNVKKRLGELQTGCPHRLALLATIEHNDARSEESKYHERFSHLRIDKSEWFNWSVDLADAIAAIKRQTVLPNGIKLIQTIDGQGCVDTDVREHWEPAALSSDPMVNAVLNVAAQLASLAKATSGLLYGLKYSKNDGMSIAEAMEVASKNISEGLESLANTLHDK